MNHKLNSALAAASAATVLITGLFTTAPITTTASAAAFAFVAVLAICYLVDFLNS